MAHEGTAEHSFLIYTQLIYTHKFAANNGFSFSFPNVVKKITLTNFLAKKTLFY